MRDEKRDWRKEWDFGGFNEKETMALMKRRLKWKTFFLYLIWVCVLGVFVQDKLRP